MTANYGMTGKRIRSVLNVVVCEDKLGLEMLSPSSTLPIFSRLRWPHWETELGIPVYMAGSARYYSW